MSHVHAFPMHTYSLFNILVIFELLGTFLIVFLSLPLFLFTLVVSMAPKRKFIPAWNPFHFDASSSSDSTSFSLFDFVMMMPTRHSRRTFLNEVFIWNTKSYWQISLTLNFPLSFTVGNGSHCMTSRSLVLSCSFKSFTLTCTRLIVQYLSSLLTFEVRASLSHHSLLQMCFRFL